MSFSTPIHTNEQSVDRVLRAGLPVLLVFWRRGSPLSERLDHALGQLAAAFAGRALVAKVDLGAEAGLARRYGVSRAPELVLVSGGAELGRAQGAAEGPALRAWLEGLLGGTRPAAPQGPSEPLAGGGPAPERQRAANGHGAGPADSPRPRAPSGGAAGPLTLTEASFDTVVGKGDGPVLVDFWAPWCGPCRAVAPAVEGLAREFAGRAVVAKLNVDEHPAIARRFGISGIPALYIFKQGKVVERLVGAQPAAALRQALARHVA